MSIPKIRVYPHLPRVARNHPLILAQVAIVSTFRTAPGHSPRRCPVGSSACPAARRSGSSEHWSAVAAVHCPVGYYSPGEGERRQARTSRRKKIGDHFKNKNKKKNNKSSMNVRSSKYMFLSLSCCEAELYIYINKEDWHEDYLYK